MSSSKKPIVQWRPDSNDEFLLASNEIHVYRFDASVMSSSVQEGAAVGAGVDASKVFRQISTVSDVQFPRCISWCHRSSDRLAACGLSSGKLLIVDLEQSDSKAGIIKEYALRSSRTCFSVDWNPLFHNWIAAGYDRIGKENCVMIWDSQVGVPALFLNAPDVAVPRKSSSKTVSNIGAFNASPARVGLTGVYVDLNENSSVDGLNGGGAHGLGAVNSSLANKDKTGTGKPTYDFQGQEAAVSIAWLPFDPMSLAVGSGTRWLRIYDLRDTNTPKVQVAHSAKQVLGVRFDPFNHNRLMSYSDDGSIKLWDIRRMDSPFTSFTAGPKALVQAEWSSCVQDEIFTLCKDESIVRRWSVRDGPVKGNHPFAWHSVYLARLNGSQNASFHDQITAMHGGALSEESPANNSFTNPGSANSQSTSASASNNSHHNNSSAAAFAVNAMFSAPVLPTFGISTGMNTFGSEADAIAVLGFSLHPKISDLLVSISSDGFLQATKILTTPQYAVGASGLVALERDHACVEVLQVIMNDVSDTVRKRCQMGYGIDCAKNADISRILGQSNVESFWRWVDRMKQMSFEDSANSKAEASAFPGLVKVLGLASNSSVENAPLPFRPVKISEETDKYFRLQFKGSMPDRRNVALQMCGIPIIQASLPLIDGMTDVVTAERLVAQATFMHDVPRASRMLNQISEGEMFSTDARQAFYFFGLALASYSREDKLNWKARMVDQPMVKSLLRKSPYLFAALVFLTAEKSLIEPFLRDASLQIVDRIAMALLILPDGDLAAFLKEMKNRYVRGGVLEGVLLTGFDRDFLDLLQQYVNDTADLQTAAHILLQFPKHMYSALTVRSSEDPAPVWVNWVDEYRDLLDRWGLYLVRADYDVCLTSFWNRLGLSQSMSRSSTNDAPPVHLACAFCGASLLHGAPLKKSVAPGNPGGGSQPPNPVPGAGWGSLSRTSTVAVKKENRPSVCASCSKSLMKCSVCGITYGSPIASCGDIEFSNSSVLGPPTTGTPSAIGQVSATFSAASRFSSTPSLMVASEREGVQHRDLSFGPDTWFSWCQSCKHGGHVRHLVEWFGAHDVCPVKDCDCHCMSLDHI
eukprot:ANDGO_03996.mRNA.1 WD repeat-containing protein mio